MAQDKANISIHSESLMDLESNSMMMEYQQQDKSYISVESGALLELESKSMTIVQDKSVVSESTKSMNDLESSMCGSNPAVPTAASSIIDDGEDDLMSLESASVANSTTIPRNNPFVIVSNNTNDESVVIEQSTSNPPSVGGDDLLSLESASVTNLLRNPFAIENEQTAEEGEEEEMNPASVNGDDLMSVGSQTAASIPRNLFSNENGPPIQPPSNPPSVNGDDGEFVSIVSENVVVKPSNPFSNPNYLLEANAPQEKEIPHMIDPGHDDDISTIANDTINGSFMTGGLMDIVPIIPSASSPKKLFEDKVIKTPKHSPAKNPGSPDDVTLPETPPPMGENEGDGYPQRKRNSIYERNEKDFNRTLNTRLRRVILLAGCLGSILLGAVGVLSVSLYQYRRKDNSGEEPLLRSPQDENEPIANIVITPSAPIAPIPVPGLTFVMPTPRPVATPVPTPAPTIKISMNESSSPIDFVQEIILQASPTLEQSLNNGTTIQSAALQWLADDPALANYTQTRIVQRFALSTFFLSVTETSESLPRFGRALRGLQGVDFSDWMTYTDECNWYSTKPEGACDSNGFVRAIHLVGVGLQGSLPVELSLLSNSLEILNLDANPIYSSIPMEYGRLTNLQVLRLTSCDIDGTLPSELGDLSGLATLALGRNRLVGTIPHELSRMSSLEFLSLSSNKLTGSIPSGIGGLSVLSTFILSNNPGLTGNMPEEVCSIGAFQRLEVDCDNIGCSCCTIACNPPTPVPSEPVTPSPIIVTSPPVATEVPTNKPLFPALLPTNSPVATPSPTNSPTDVTPVAQQECVSSWITAGQTCYLTTDQIEIDLEYCDFRQFDLVAMFEASEDQNFSHSNAIFWLRSCGEQRCRGVLSNGYLTFEGKSPIWLSSPWPLQPAEYKLYLIRVSSGGSLVAHAESEAFRIGGSC